MGSRISDYGLIGNCRSAALVSNKGSIDWCCLPQFDSPAIFAGLLDEEKGGRFSIRPEGDFRSRQAYITDTNVLETHFSTDKGEVRLLDAFTIAEGEVQRSTLYPDHEILRVVEGVSGSLKMFLSYEPRIFYGLKKPKLRHQGKLGIYFFYKEGTYVFQSTLEPDQIKLSAAKDKATASFTVEKGQRVLFSLSMSGQSPAIIPELEKTGGQRMEKTIAYWKEWITKCTFSGIYKEHVKRSVLALKLLSHAPSGAIVAAPTASLPEKIGGVRNWDYRYCWLRDASFTVRALIEIGLKEEAKAYFNWILHATQLTRPRIQTVYSIYGHSSIPEKILEWLSGYFNSKPVRIGNGAHDQFQLDVYGEVADAVFSYAYLMDKFDKGTKKFTIGLGKAICKYWDQPDTGIWEIRTNLVHHTHSKVMAYVGLQRILELAERFHWRNSILKKFSDTAEKIREEIEMKGYNEKIGSYTRTFNGTSIDASLLTLSLVGYAGAGSERMRGTVEVIQKHLTKNNFVFRYLDVEDGLPGDENSFGVCTFWLVENLAKAGRITDAKQVFENVLSCMSPLGLLSEEIDNLSGELIGNYPQGLTHIGLINAALAIDSALKEEVLP